MILQKKNTAVETFEDFIRAIQDDANHLYNIQDAVETVRIMEEALSLQNTKKL